MQNYYHIGLVLVSLLTILQVGNLVISIWSKVRRRPSIDATLQGYVSREEFEKLREYADDIHRQLFDLLREQQASNLQAIKELTRSITEWQNGIERQLGRIEGKVSKS